MVRAIGLTFPVQLELCSFVEIFSATTLRKADRIRIAPFCCPLMKHSSVIAKTIKWTTNGELYNDWDQPNNT